MERGLLILGAGMTGLAAGVASGAPVLEARAEVGGICSSYYVRPGQEVELDRVPADGEAYHFERGGGHWLFGCDPLARSFLASMVTLRAYHRRSSVMLEGQPELIPFPLQNHLRHFEPSIRARVLAELVQPGPLSPTMKGWLLRSFGPTLCERFFYPFHALYTAGLYGEIAPQDAYKSPLDLPAVLRGALEEVPAAGYNVEFLYPEEGLDTLARRLASRCDVRAGHAVVAIDLQQKVVRCEGGAELPYERLISTLPLTKMIELTGLRVEGRPEPYTSVLVLNVGAVRGPRCPDDHWIYTPGARSGFHRVGFYDNVDVHFLPASARARRDRGSLYVERAYVGGARPSPEEAASYGRQVVGELQSWGWIGEAEVVSPSWIDVAYTWSWPGSTWRKRAIEALQAHQIFPVGRFAAWTFQGIAESLRDGLLAGGALR